MSALLALSDVLVDRALERAYSRGLPGDARRRAALANTPRHRAYEQIRIPASRHDHVLDDAWSMTPELADRWLLPVDPAEWAVVLDRYTRRLLSTGAPKTLDDLGQALTLLGAGHAV